MKLSLLKSDKGFGLLEIMLAVGLMSLIGFGITRITTDLIAGKKRAEVLSDFNLKMAELSTYFSSQNTCRNLMAPVVVSQTINGLIGGVDVQALELAGVPVAAKDQTFGGVVIRSITVEVLPNKIKDVLISNVPHSIYRTDVRVRTEGKDKNLGAFGDKQKTFSLVMTVQNDNNELKNCYDESTSSNTLATSCVMSGGVFEENGPQGSSCNISGNQDIVEMTNRTKALQQSITETNNRLTTIQTTLQFQIEESVANFTKELNTTNGNVAQLRVDTLNKFSETAMQINEAYSFIVALNSEHTNMTQNLANLSMQTDQDNQLMTGNVQNLANVVNVNNQKVQAFHNQQQVYSANLTNKMAANDNAQQVALNSLKNQVNINETEQVAVNNTIKNQMAAQDNATQTAFNKVNNDVSVKKTQQLAVANEIENKMAAQNQATQYAANNLQSEVAVVSADQATVNSGFLTQIKAVGDSTVEVENNLVQTINVNKDTVIATVNKVSNNVNKLKNDTTATKQNLTSMIDTSKQQTDTKINVLNQQALTMGSALANLTNTLGSMSSSLNSAIGKVNAGGANQADINSLAGRANNVNNQVKALKAFALPPAQGGGGGGN